MENGHGIKREGRVKGTGGLDRCARLQREETADEECYNHLILISTKLIQQIKKKGLSNSSDWLYF